MNRIGILTFHRTTNFGSLLQTYALYYTIVRHGYDCKIIDYRCPAIEKREKLTSKYISTSIKATLNNILFLRKHKKKAAAFDNFIKENMILTKSYWPTTIKDSQEEFDRFLVGSDLVWGRDITEKDYTYFLDFVDDSTLKYAFSSSVGNYDKQGDESIIKKLLQRFNRIAVREKDAIDWLNQLGINRAEWVCDPTMLLTQEEWVKSIKPRKFDDKYVLVYFLDSNKKLLNDAKKYAKLHGYKVYFINYNRPQPHVHNISPKTLEEFLGLILHAELVFTASYHGLLFSLYFKKELLFYTRAHKARVLSIADRFRIADHCGDNISVEHYQPIDYKQVNDAISSFRSSSLHILFEMLGTNK